MRLVRMGNRLFFLTTGAIMILYVMMFYVSSNATSNARRICKLTQAVAILNYELEKIKSRDNAGRT